MVKRPGCLKNDRVGVVFLYITLLFIVMVVAARWFGCQKTGKEVGIPSCHRTLLAKGIDGTQNAVVRSKAPTWTSATWTLGAAP